MTTLTLTVLEAADPKAAVAAIDAAAPGSRRRLSASLRDALRGRPAAVRRYVRAHRELTERLLAAMHEARPDLVLRDDAGEYCVAQSGGCSHASIELLRTFAAESPFSPWVQVKGPGTGVALDLNNATEKDLSRLPAMGPGLAHLVVQDRAAHGSFANVEDLARVKGINQQRMKNLSAFLYVIPATHTVSSGPVSGQQP